jgi:D-sedoheptulose 7-phosphate isomerase
MSLSAQQISEILNRSAAIKQTIASDPNLCAEIVKAATILQDTVKRGGTIYACGNGGSTCDATHLVEELVARFKRERPGIKAMHLMDAAVLTCWSNDYEYESAFERQVKTFCGPKDALVAISTSGNSKNIIRAVRAAKAQSTAVIGFTGKDGGELRSLCDVALVVPASETERIQEVHITFVHILCEALENGTASPRACP